MSESPEKSLEDLRKLIEENERSLLQAKRLLEWLEAHAANEAIRRTLEVSKEELQRQVQRLDKPLAEGDPAKLNPAISPKTPPNPGSQLSR
jgi:hypothetical protein